MPELVCASTSHSQSLFTVKETFSKTAANAFICTSVNSNALSHAIMEREKTSKGRNYALLSPTIRFIRINSSASKTSWLLMAEAWNKNSHSFSIYNSVKKKRIYMPCSITQFAVLTQDCQYQLKIAVNHHSVAFYKPFTTYQWKHASFDQIC